MIQLVDKFCAKAGMNSDSRPRKDFVDTVYRLVDHCLKIANDHRATISRFDLEKGQSTLDEKTATRIRSLSLKTIHTLAEIVPTLYGYLSDDKSRAASNVISTVMSYLRDRSEHNLPWAGVSSMFLFNLLEQGYTTKTLKKEILDIFYDNNFFYMDYVALEKWRHILNHVMGADKTAYQDLLRTVSKSLQSHATMVFVGKEQENLMRARHIKRLALVLLAGEFDQYSTSVPAIQELMFEALKLSHAPTVYEQVFTCMRVLMIRVSSSRLSSFWPVVLTEMMRIFGYGGRVTCDSSLLLSAAKFYDIAILSGSEQFKLYEWIFTTEYYDNVEKSGSFIPFIEQLSQQASTESPIKLNIPLRNEKQPLILMRSIDSQEQLCSYLKHYSEAVYTNLVTGGHAVNEIVEAVIAADMVEFVNVRNFARSPQQLITERAKMNLERIDNTLKMESYGETDLGNDIIMDLDETDDLEVPPSVPRPEVEEDPVSPAERPLHHRSAPAVPSDRTAAL